MSEMMFIRLSNEIDGLGITIGEKTELLETAFTENNERLITSLEQTIRDLNLRLNATIAARDRLTTIPADTAPGKIYIYPPTESPPPLYPNHTIPFVR